MTVTFFRLRARLVMIVWDASSQVHKIYYYILASMPILHGVCMLSRDKSLSSALAFLREKYRWED